MYFYKVLSDIILQVALLNWPWIQHSPIGTQDYAAGGHTSYELYQPQLPSEQIKTAGEY